MIYKEGWIDAIPICFYIIIITEILPLQLPLCKRSISRCKKGRLMPFRAHSSGKRDEESQVLGWDKTFLSKKKKSKQKGRLRSYK